MSLTKVPKKWQTPKTDAAQAGEEAWKGKMSLVVPRGPVRCLKMFRLNNSQKSVSALYSLYIDVTQRNGAEPNIKQRNI